MDSRRMAALAAGLGLAALLAGCQDRQQSAAADGVEQLRAQGEAAFDGMRGSAEEIEAQLIAKVREKPVTSLAIAAGVGFLFALLSRR